MSSPSGRIKAPQARAENETRNETTAERIKKERREADVDFNVKVMKARALRKIMMDRGITTDEERAKNPSIVALMEKYNDEAMTATNVIAVYNEIERERL